MLAQASNRCALWVSIVFLTLPIASAQPAAPTAARVVEIVGEASFTLGDQKAQPLKPLMPIPEGAVVRTGKGAFVKLQLADKSVVDLGAHADLRLTEAKANDQVELGLDSGRIKAFVKHRMDGKRSFRIRTKTSTMGVRGTQFVVAVFQSPEGKVNTEYYCLSGSIEVKDLADGAKAKPALLTGGYGLSVATRDPGQPARDIAQAPQPQKIPAKTLKMIGGKDFLITAPPAVGAGGGFSSNPGSEGQHGDSKFRKKPNLPGNIPVIPERGPGADKPDPKIDAPFIPPIKTPGDKGDRELGPKLPGSGDRPPGKNANDAGGLLNTMGTAAPSFTAGAPGSVGAIPPTVGSNVGTNTVPNAEANQVPNLTSNIAATPVGGASAIGSGALPGTTIITGGALPANTTDPKANQTNIAPAVDNRGPATKPIGSVLAK